MNAVKDWSQYRPTEFEYVNKWVRNWFSNFAESQFQIDGIRYRSVETYYQSHKSNNRSDWERMSQMDSPLAKKEGRKLNIRPDWEEIKYEIMKTALRLKFSIPKWRDKLLATGNEILVEWNNWKDLCWGVSIMDNKGKNLLGLALMEIRDEIKTKEDAKDNTSDNDI